MKKNLENVRNFNITNGGELENDQNDNKDKRSISTR